jgi:TetR/AcrR family transcriptional regulator, transcriptional repressor for nem operon
VSRLTKKIDESLNTFTALSVSNQQTKVLSSSFQSVTSLTRSAVMKCGMATAQCSCRPLACEVACLSDCDVGLSGYYKQKLNLQHLDFRRFLASLTLLIGRCTLPGMLAVRKRSRRRRATSRDPEHTRELLLQAAFQEMHRSGFRSADLDAILAAAGVTKGALYYYFDNKEALGYAVVDEVIASNLHQKWVQPLRNAKNPIDGLVRIVQSESLKREDVQHGCPLLNLSQEMSGLNEGFRRRTARVFKDWHDAVAKALREGQKLGVVRNDINANETATFLIAAYEGHVVLGKNSQDARMLQSGQRSVIRHLQSLRPVRCRP